MSAPTDILEIHPLGGIDQRWRVSGRAAARVQDLSWSDQQSWQYAGGYRGLADDYDSQGSPANAFEDHARINSLFWFSQHSGARRWLIWETDDGEMQAFNGSISHPSPTTCYVNLRRADGTAYDSSNAARTNQRGPAPGTSSAIYADRLYLVNGLDEALVYNGRYLERAGFGAPAGPPDISIMETSTALKQLGLGAYGEATAARLCAYRWKQRFVGERGQVSPWSAASPLVSFENPSGGAARLGAYIHLQRGPAWAVAREVARTANTLDSNGEPITLGAGDLFYRLRLIPDNVSEGFEDYTPDATLGALVLDEDAGTWPTGARYIAVFKNTMFAVGNDGQLRFSAPNEPENFPPDNVIDLGDLRGSHATGLLASRNSLVIFKQRSLWLVKGDPLNGFSAQPITMDTGCAAPRSIQEVPGLGIIFLASDGVYLLQGALDFSGAPTGVVHLSTQIPDIIGTLNLSALDNARSAIYHADREYWLVVPTLGSAENDLVLVYHYEVGAWSTREGFPISAMVVAGDEQGRLLFGSHDGDYPGLHVYSRGADTKGEGGPDVSPLYETAAHDFGRLYRNFRPVFADVQAVAYSNEELVLDYRINRKLLQIREEAGADDDGRTQQDPADRLPVYGEAVWGTARWASRRPVVLTWDTSAAHKEPTREVQVTISGAGRRVELVAVAIEILSDKHRQRPISEAIGGGQGRHA